MELLDNLERHFFDGVHPLTLKESKESLYPDSDTSVTEASAVEKRRDLLRKLTKAKLSDSNLPKSSEPHERANYVRSSDDAWKTLVKSSKFGPSVSRSNRPLAKSFRRLCLSDQNLAQFPQVSMRKGLGAASTSCTTLHLPVTSRSYTDDGTVTMSLSRFSQNDRQSGMFPPLSCRSSDTDRPEASTLSRQRSEVKLPALHPQRLATVEDEQSPTPEVQIPKEESAAPIQKPIDISECVSPTRTAIYNVEHNWMLREEYNNSVKRINRFAKYLTIPLPDKDADITIQKRLNEVKAMVTRRAELWHVWELMCEEQKDMILRIADIPAHQLKKDRRKKWKSIDVLRNAAHMCYILVKAFVNRRAYAEPDQAPVAPAAMRRQQQIIATDQHEPVTKSSLGFETQLAMSIAPPLRREKDIKLILWVLRATKAFNHLFPAEMETELAKVVAYEKYDDGRIIAKQGRTPDRFYYIMTGKVHLIQEYVLNAGTVQKSMGYLTKGMTTDPNELDNNWLRDVNLVAKGQVEVLLIEKSVLMQNGKSPTVQEESIEDFARLQHTTAGPPIEFLRNIELFHEFPCERFLDCGDALEYRYYSQNRTVVEDSNRTPWLHVIKSGSVKVIREQSVINTTNDKLLFSGRSVEELGCVKPFSHADAMLGILAQQRKMKSKLTLPEISESKHSKVNSDKSERGSSKSGTQSPDSPTVTSTSRRSTLSQNDIPQTDIKQRKLISGDPILATMVNIPIKSELEPETQGPFMPREKTTWSVKPLGEVKAPAESAQRRARVQLDLLTTGDVFGLSAMAAKLRRRDEEITKGLEHMESPLASEGPGVSLVSDGAEVIRISKRFFLQHARNNTMLKIETMQREYMSQEEAMEQLYEKETWHKYKSALMSRTLRSLIKS